MSSFGFSKSPSLAAKEGKKVKKYVFLPLTRRNRKNGNVELSAVPHSSFFACLWAKNLAVKDDIQRKSLQKFAWSKCFRETVRLRMS